MGQQAEKWTGGEKAAVGVAVLFLLMLVAQIVRYFINK